MGLGCPMELDDLPFLSEHWGLMSKPQQLLVSSCAQVCLWKPCRHRLHCVGSVGRGKEVFLDSEARKK